MTDFWWKRHDTAPQMQVQLKDSGGVPVDITGATVKFIMKASAGSTPKVNATADIITAASGIVGYTPLATDTDTAGDYSVEWEVTYSSGTKQTFPNPGYNAITVTADLDDA